MRACWCARPPVDAGFCLHELVRVISLRRAPTSRRRAIRSKNSCIGVENSSNSSKGVGSGLMVLSMIDSFWNPPLWGILATRKECIGHTNLVMECTSVPLAGHQAVHTAWSHWRAIARPAKKPAVEKFKSFAVSGNFWRRRAFA